MDPEEDTAQSPHPDSEVDDSPPAPITKAKKKLSEKQLQALERGREKNALKRKQQAARKRESDAKEIRQELREARLKTKDDPTGRTQAPKAPKPKTVYKELIKLERG